MFCVNCGKEISSGSSFCPECGAAQQGMTPPPTSPNVASSLPDDDVSSKYAWSLATVPILVSWFVAAFGFSFWIVTLCTILLNAIFLMLDSDELKKSGINVNSWMWMGVVLVPAYLFVRASRTNKKYGYAIAWCLMFFFDLLI